MKINYEKTYTLTREEFSAISSYTNWLSFHPIPCEDCRAAKAGKCKPYTIWDNAFKKEEGCQDIKDWIIAGEDFRGAFEELDEDILRELIEAMYNLSYAKSNKEKAETLYCLADNKLKKMQAINRIEIDGSSKDKNLWNKEA